MTMTNTLTCPQCHQQVAPLLEQCPFCTAIIPQHPTDDSMAITQPLPAQSPLPPQQQFPTQQMPPMPQFPQQFPPQQKNSAAGKGNIALVIGIALLTLVVALAGVLFATGMFDKKSKDVPATSAATVTVTPSSTPTPSTSTVTVTATPSVSPTPSVSATSPSATALPVAPSLPSSMMQCASTIAVNDVTSCEFAERVSSDYFLRQERRKPVLLNVWSPTTSQSYLMTCIPYNGQVQCTGGNNALVVLTGVN
ncbi:MAG: hypothetical protein ACRCWS_03390 [Propionibacteriaceae bacterium]